MLRDKDLTRALKGPVCPIISLEPVLLTEAVKMLRQQVLTAAADFNRDEFRAGEGGMIRVIEAARTLPMMAPRRWVHLRDVHRLKAADAEPLLGYLEEPADTTFFCISGQKVDKRTKLGKRLAKLSTFVDLKAPKPHELPLYIVDRAKGRNIEVSRSAADLVADCIGLDIGAIDQAIEQLDIYCGGSKPIEMSNVEALVVPVRVRRIFDLTDALGQRDLAAATLLVRNAIDGGEAALRILAMVARQFRILLRIKAAVGSDADKARAAGVAPFLVRSLVQQAERYSELELCAALAAAAVADLQLKSSRLNPGVVLDRLLIDIISTATPSTVTS